MSVPFQRVWSIPELRARCLEVLADSDSDGEAVENAISTLANECKLGWNRAREIAFQEHLKTLGEEFEDDGGLMGDGYYSW